MDLWQMLMELVLLLSGAFFLGSLAQRFKQSPILGYILAGVAAGPVINNAAAVEQMAELGVSLLLFSIGLEFSFGQLKRMGKTAFGGGACQVGMTLGLVSLIAAPFVPFPTAVALGALTALSSTTIVLRVLVDRGEMESVHGRTSLGILLFQDMAIVPLVLLMGLLSPTGADAGIAMHMIRLLASVGGLILVLYILLYHLIPRLLSSALLFANRELTVLFAASTGLGATWAAHAIGISPALGAFAAGMLLGESPFATQVRADIGSLRIMMVTLFFASVGMIVKPLWFASHLHLILPLAAAVFVLKTGIIFFVARIFGLPRQHALATGIVLGQVGEFSFVLVAAAREGMLITDTAMDLIVSVTIVLMLATPYMVVSARPLAHRILNLLPGQSPGARPQNETDSIADSRRVIVVGLGPSGRHVVHTLKQNNFEPVIIDVNPESRQFARQEKLKIHLGDAASDEILNHAGLARASMVVVTVPDTKIAAQVIRAVRRSAPIVSIVARNRYNRYKQDLVDAGATVIIDEETLMGEAISRTVTNCIEDGSCTLMASRMSGKEMPDQDGV